jgi:hypothetical protein
LFFSCSEDDSSYISHSENITEQVSNNDDDASTENGDNTDNQDYQIGDFYLGGIIFYLDGNGGGKVCALEDKPTPIEWTLPAYQDTTVPDVGARSNTDGAANTDAIIAQTGLAAANTYAAGLCRLYNTPGNNDLGQWYLPAKGELDLMWINLADSDGDGVNYGPDDPNNIGNFERTTYWSSTESVSYRVNFNELAYIQFFHSGYQAYGNKYLFPSLVRAVRAF